MFNGSAVNMFVSVQHPVRLGRQKSGKKNGSEVSTFRPQPCLHLRSGRQKGAIWATALGLPGSLFAYQRNERFELDEKEKPSSVPA